MDQVRAGRRQMNTGVVSKPSDGRLEESSPGRSRRGCRPLICSIVRQGPARCRLVSYGRSAIKGDVCDVDDYSLRWPFRWCSDSWPRRCGSDDSSSESTTAVDGTVAATEDAEATETVPPEAEGDVDTSIVVEIETPVFGGSIAMGLEAEPNGFRPWEDGCSDPCVNMARTIFDPLIQQNGEGEHEGYLAESIEANEDFTVWTMTLRPDVAFHNGVPLTAQTIVDMFAVQQSGAISAGRIATTSLIGVEAADDLTVVYTLGASNSVFPANLTSVELGYVFEPAAAVADPVGFSTAPVGTGPFVMQSRDIDNETVVVRNENYWRTADNGDRLPYLDSIAFRPIPDEGTRLDVLLSRTVDVIDVAPGHDP